eukprot:11977107-Ditylum_brightwellii.AAC.1
MNMTNTKQPSKGFSDLPSKRLPSMIIDFFGVKGKRGRPVKSKSRNKANAAVAVQVVAVAALVPGGVSRNPHNNFVIKKTSKTVHGETRTETSVPITGKEYSLLPYVLLQRYMSTTILRGILPEVIDLDEEEEKDDKVEIPAEVKGQKGKRRQWNHPDNWNWLEAALLLTRKIAINNVVSEVPRSTLSRLYKRLQEQDVTHENGQKTKWDELKLGDINNCRHDIINTKRGSKGLQLLYQEEIFDKASGRGAGEEGTIHNNQAPPDDNSLSEAMSQLYFYYTG